MIIKEKLRFDAIKLYYDICIKLNELNQSQRFITEKLGISRTILFRLNKNKEIKLDSLLTLLTWLEEPVDNYFYYSKIDLKNKEEISKEIQKNEKILKTLKIQIERLRRNMTKKSSYNTKLKLKNCSSEAWLVGGRIREYKKLI